MNNAGYCAIVCEVVPDGKHGPYAVASFARNGKDIKVTFSLKPPVWRCNGSPEPGTYVILHDVRKKRAGWRAMLARFQRPDDIQQPVTSNEQRGGGK